MRKFDKFRDLLKEDTLLGKKPFDPDHDPPPDPADRAAQCDNALTLVKAMRYNLYKISPAFGIILGKMKIILTYDVPTFAVDNFNNIYINPAFALSMNKLEVLGVLAHETMHIATMTFFRQKGRDLKLWNYATDYMMNFDLVKSGFSLPSKGLIPDKDGSVHLKYPNGKTITVNITNKTAEWLYDQMVRNMPPNSGKGQGQGQGQPGQSIPGSGSGDPIPVDSKGNELTPSDEHMKDPKPPEGEGKAAGGLKAEPGSDEPNVSAPTVAEVKNMMSQAKNAAAMRPNNKSEGRGNGGPGDVEGVLFKQIETTTDYRQVLKNLFQKTQQFYDWRKPSRRGLAVGSYLPKNTTIHEPGDIAVAIDTSGSISADEVNIIMNEVARLMKQFPRITIEVVLWNGEVYFHKAVPTRNPADVLNTISKNIRSGGTTLSSVADFYTKNKLKTPKAVAYFTDGYVEDKPRVLKTQNVFMVFKWGNPETLRKALAGPVYLIDIDK